MKIEDLQPVLSTHPFFANMDPTALKTIVGCCANEVFKPGACVYREGEPINKFYLIREGRVNLETYVPGRPPVAIETVEAGGILGWSWLVPPYKSRSDANAASIVRAISIDGACLRDKIEADRVLGYELYKRILPVLAQRYHSCRTRLVELATEPVAYG